MCPQSGDRAVQYVLILARVFEGEQQVLHAILRERVRDVGVSPCQRRSNRLPCLYLVIASPAIWLPNSGGPLFCLQNQVHLILKTRNNARNRSRKRL